MYSLNICFLVFAIQSFTVESHDVTVIHISNGKIRGQIRSSYSGKEFLAFEGIPYAAPPVGNRRFKLPERPDNWSGILEASNNTQVCAQVSKTLPRVEGTEDCLYLNVYTPKNSKLLNQSLPVFVHIHGGAFQYNSKTPWKPDYFIEDEVILVTLNYRLGVLGFLSTSDGVIPGNLGLKDQRFALKWISKNINKFGGSPDKVILGGQSAGSVAASYQLLDANNEGLFRGVILMSGSALCHHEIQLIPQKVSYKLGEVLNPSFANSSQELLTILQKTPIEQLLLTANSLSFKSIFLDKENPIQIGVINNIWLPIVETDKDQEILIDRPMHQAFIDGNFLKVPIIAGYTTSEIVYYTDHPNVIAKADILDAKPDLLISDKLKINNKLEAGIKLKKAYTNSFEKNPEAVLEYLTDNFYKIPILRQAELAMKHIPVYLYELSHAYNSQYKIQGKLVTVHTSELPLLFYSFMMKLPKNHLTQNRLQKLWTNFIKFQNPTPVQDNLLIHWPKTTDNLEYLNINATLEVLSHPTRYTSWKNILNAYMSKPYFVY